MTKSMSKLKISLLFPIVFISVFGFLFSFSVQEARAATETLRPNAAGDAGEMASGSIEGQYPSSGAHWDKVDDATADDANTYVYSAVGSFREDLYNLPNHSVGSGTINFVKIYYRGRCKNKDTYGCTVCAILKTNGGEKKTTGCVQIASWTTNSQQYNTNPVTGQPWTWAEIDALQIGGYIGGYNATYAAQLTQVYVEIDYASITAPAVTTDTATVNLSNSQATLNGNVTATGGENPSQRVLEWGTSSGNYTNSYDVGSGGIGGFSYAITLTPGTIYYYRAKVYNSGGWGYGAEKRVVIYQASGGQQSFTTESLCKDVCESCSTGECCSGFHCQNGVCCADGQTCCTGNAHCPADSCIDSYQHIDYYCNASVCYCESSTTTCTAGGCCQIACSSATGCYTTAGTCPESCGTNTLVMGQTCSGCGANGATGSCGGGTTYACNATTHTECQSASCGGATYYCTQDGGTWQWRTSDNPDRCGGNSDGCYDDYDNGCQIKDFRCSAGACTFTPSNQHADTSCSYTGCSTDNCTKTGTYNNYFCDAGSCTAQSDSCSEVCGIKTACSGGVCYSDTGDGDLCNTEMKASPGEGDGNYGIGGDYNCQGSCDSSGNCDYAVNCISIDTTSPTTEIRIFDSTDTDITDTKSWLKSDNYTIKFKAIDNESGLDYYEYYIYECEEGGIPCNITIDHITGNYTGEIDIEVTKEHSMGAGKSPKKYYLEGLGRYKILFLPTDKAGNTESNPEKTTRYVNFDFTPPETWIE